MTEQAAQVDFYRHGDYLSVYGTDAKIAAKVLGLVRLTVDISREIKPYPEWLKGGESHTFIPVYNHQNCFEMLEREGWKPRIVA